WRTFGISTDQVRQRAAAYAAAGKKYGPRSGPFASIEELQMVLGMDPAIYRTVASQVPLWSGRETPDIATATPLQLAARQGVDAQRANEMYAARMRGQQGTELAGGNGVTHSIRSEASLADGTRAILRATVRLNGVRSGAQPYAVLRWQEGDE